MADLPLVLAIDQGTTSSRAIVFDLDGAAVSMAQKDFTQHYPHGGWVEHDPEDIWQSTLDVCREAIAALGERERALTAIGITNQRETTVVWDRESGQPLHNAIVWQDRRTAPRCRELAEAGHGELFTRKTGLLLDAYFSGTKIAWILEHVDGARELADAGRLAFGTIDCFLIWRLTGGRVHATDATNASRTLLYDIHTQDWDDELLDLVGVPRDMLPDVRDCAADYGITDAALLGRALPIRGVAGDQQAAGVGQACFSPGMVKSTYGTGCFALMNTGQRAVRSQNRLLTTIAYRLNGRTSYALEGSIFVAGASVQWLRDALGVVANAGETQMLAAGLHGNDGVYLVPAFTGLGAPHWDPDARGAVFGLTRDSGPAQLARAALESVCYQTRDLVQAMALDSGVAVDTLRVDGGMVVNDWLVQYLADIVDVVVERPRVTETTALGAAALAALGVGLYADIDELSAQWQREARFEPAMQERERERLLADWARAVDCTRRFGNAG